MDCVIYIRWSSAEQGKGSSRERQTEDCRRYAAAKVWKVVDEIEDDGVSGFTGSNMATGELGRFVQDVESGRFPGGIILLVEKLDRLSRRQAKIVFSWMLRVTELGVKVATVDGDRIYTADNLDMATIIELIVKSALAHEESQKKSDRLAKAWAAKRRKIDSGERIVMTKRAPAWLTVEDNAFVLIADRAAIICRIFEETVEGYGKATIARRLNVDGIKPFGRATGWHASYVQKILHSNTVLGEMQPGQKSRGERRTLVGDPIGGYYPAVVDADLHARARRAMAGRSRQVSGRGRRLVNILSGLAKCECGSVMTFRGKGSARRANGALVRQDYLICDSYQRGRGCPSGRHFNYPAWEAGILDAVLIRALEDRHFAVQDKTHDLEVELAETIRTLEGTIRKRDVALELHLESGESHVKERWSALVGEAGELARTISTLRQRVSESRGAVSPAEHRRRIYDLHAQMDDGDEDKRFEARSRVMEAVHELIGSITFAADPPVAVVTGRDGLGIDIEMVGGSGEDTKFFYRFDEGFLPEY